MNRALLLLCLLVLSAGVAQGLDTSLRDRLEAEVAAAEARQQQLQRALQAIQDALGETRAVLGARIAERDETARQLAELRSAQGALEVDIAALEDQRAATDLRIVALERDLAILRQRAEALLLNLYKQRANRFARVLAQSQTFQELQVRNYYLSLLSQQDVALVTQIDQTLGQLFDAQTQLTRQYQALELKGEELRQNQTKQEAAQRRLSAIIAELEATEEGQLAQQLDLLETQNRVASLTDELQRDLGAELQRLAQEQARLALERPRLPTVTPQGSPLPEIFPSGFANPIVGGRVEIGFMEVDNQNVLLRAEVANAAVFSAQSGVVTAVSFVSANEGWLVAIQHSSELATVYTNLREPQVRADDIVSQRQLLGYLGGSSLLPNDMLKLWVRVSDATGRRVFVNPGEVFGF